MSEPRPYTIYTVTPPRRAGRRLRIVLVALGVMLCLGLLAAAISYLWLDRLIARTHGGPGHSAAVSILRQTTAPLESRTEVTGQIPDLSSAMDIAVFGCDRREDDGGPEQYGRSDTIMLVRVDPRANFISILSLPRDLRVEVPGRGLQKLNAAYSYGGPALAIETIQNLTGVDFDHYVTVDFDAFRRVTTALGGVWIDVDRRYYHQSQKGDPNYHENLDIQAGYQRLMGEDALDFVRFRFDRNMDFGRMQRQQLFLREAKRQFASMSTVFKIPEIAGLVARNVATSLSTNDIISLAFFALRLDSSRIKHLSVIGDPQEINGVSYVIVSPESIANAVREYRSAPVGSGQAAASAEGGDTGIQESQSQSASDSTSPTSAEESIDLSGTKVEVLNGNRRTGQAAAAASILRAAGAVIVSVGDAPTTQELTSVVYPSGLEAQARAVAKCLRVGKIIMDTGLDHIKVILGYDFNVEYDRVVSPGPSGIIYEDEYKALQTMVSFPMLGPTFIPAGYRYVDRRVYEIDAGAQGRFPAVKTIYKFGVEDQYLGIMQTTFVDAPIASPGEKIVVEGVTFTVVGTASATDRVWWNKNGVLYWVSNTLSHLVSREDLLRVATSMVPVPR